MSGDVEKCSKYGYITYHGLFGLYARYPFTKLGHTVVMNIWNVETLTKAMYHTWAELRCIMSVSNKLSYLLVSVMLLSQDRITIIFTVKFEINNITFTIKYSFESQSN